MNVGDIITTKNGTDLKIEKVGKNILICRVVDYIDKSTATIKKTDLRIIKKTNVIFTQKTLF